MYLFHNLLLGLLYTYISQVRIHTKHSLKIAGLYGLQVTNLIAGAKHSCFTFYGPKNSLNPKLDSFISIKVSYSRKKIFLHCLLTFSY